MYVVVVMLLLSLIYFLTKTLHVVKYSETIENALELCIGVCILD